MARYWEIMLHLQGDESIPACTCQWFSLCRSLLQTRIYRCQKQPCSNSESCYVVAVAVSSVKESTLTVCNGPALLICGEGQRKPESCTLAALGGQKMVGSVGTVVNPGIPRVLGGAELLTGNLQTAWKHSPGKAQKFAGWASRELVKQAGRYADFHLKEYIFLQDVWFWMNSLFLIGKKFHSLKKKKYCY